LASDKGQIWWGSNTPAGIKRFIKRAKIVSETLEGLGDPKVLELGCATGTFSGFVLDEIPSLRLTCCDISSKCIELATQRYKEFKNVCFEAVDLLSRHYASGEFDCIIGNSIIHHLPAETILKECFRIVRPGGLIIFFEPNMMNPQIALEKNIPAIGKLLQNSDDETAFFRWPLAKVLRSIGFDDVSVKPFDFLHPIVPKIAIAAVEAIGGLLEKIPILKEISGSLIIRAHKPDNIVSDLE
jgi:SAM-dependent methyltransferase